MGITGIDLFNHNVVTIMDLIGKWSVSRRDRVVRSRTSCFAYRTECMPKDCMLHGMHAKKSEAAIFGSPTSDFSGLFSQKLFDIYECNLHRL